MWRQCLANVVGDRWSGALTFSPILKIGPHPPAAGRSGVWAIGRAACPAGQGRQGLMVRVQPEMAKLLDDWRRKQEDLPGRPEAIRRLVELGLKAKR